jgi:hypothetical protein
MRSSHPRSPIDHPSNGSKSQIFGQLQSLFLLFFFGVTDGEASVQGGGDAHAPDARDRFAGQAGGRGNGGRGGGCAGGGGGRGFAP